MKKYNPEKYHRHSIRLRNYDYSQDGLYFITICTHERQLMFGNIPDNEMMLSPLGKTANEYWVEISSYFNSVKLHEYIIMPNHMHGIIEIEGAINQGAINRAPTEASGGFAGTLNPMLRINLSQIVRWYKGRTTYECRKTQADFAWQRNYYEHIIRNEQDYIRIAEYITNNTANWPDDRFYSP